MKHYKIKVVGFIVLILLCLIAWASVWGNIAYTFTQLTLAILMIVLVWQLFRFINLTNQQIATFLMAIKYHETGLSFPEKTSSTFDQLHRGFNDSLAQLNALKEKTEDESAWIKQIANHLPFGLLLCDHTYKVVYYNATSLEQFALPSLKSLTDLDFNYPGISKQLIHLSKGHDESIQLSPQNKLYIQKSGFKTDETYYGFLIKSTAESDGDVELDAWMNLMKVMTHEIMNSITAISSLTSNIKQSLKQESSEVKEIVERIEKRSQSLIDFTDNYREVISVKAPNSKWFSLSHLIEEQVKLLNNELKGIEVQINGDQSLNIYADRNQMAQVFINLFLNAIHALKNSSDPKITIQFQRDLQFCILSFEDNGSGIETAHQNKVFIPFYTTRKEGKGIGLSLCRQLMRKNLGSISLKHSEAGKTTWLLRWKMSE